LAWYGGDKESESQLHSLFFLYDRIPYNSYVQYGVYRPLFGLLRDDRTDLTATVMGLDPRANFRTFSFGAAPGVPFFNLHYVQPMNESSYARDKGLVFNVGARFRRHGLHIMLSYWNTKAEDLGTLHQIKKQMMAITGGFTLGRYTAIGDLTRLSQETSDLRKDTGATMTLDNRFRLWRENYLKAIWQNLNTALDMREGKATSYEVGVVSYPISSLSLELSYKALTETTPTASVDDKTTLAQLHFFY
jgi:hypothetical protein